MGLKKRRRRRGGGSDGPIWGRREEVVGDLGLGMRIGGV